MTLGASAASVSAGRPTVGVGDGVGDGDGGAVLSEPDTEDDEEGEEDEAKKAMENFPGVVVVRSVTREVGRRTSTR